MAESCRKRKYAAERCRKYAADKRLCLDRIDSNDDEYLVRKLNQLRLENWPSAVKVRLFISDNVNWIWFDGSKRKYMINDLADLLTFLQNTATTITCLSITCAQIRLKSKYIEIEQLILNHCCDFLVKLEINSTQLLVMSEVTNPFLFVEQLKLNGCELSANLSQKFNTLFPSVRRLVLIECKVFDPTCIEARFECLEKLTISGKRKNRNIFKKDNIKEAIRLNSQIRDLNIEFHSTNDRECSTTHLDFNLNKDFYRFVSENLPKLQSLWIYGERKIEVVPCDDDIDFMRLEKLSVQHIYKKCPASITPFKFNRLRVLKLDHLVTLTHEWIQFIIVNEDLLKLTIGMDDDYKETKLQIDRDQLLEIVRWLTKLEELRLPADAIQSADVIAILSKRKSLKKVHVSNYREDCIVGQFDKLTAKKKWYIDYDLYDIILKRCH